MASAPVLPREPLQSRHVVFDANLSRTIFSTLEQHVSEEAKDALDRTVKKSAEQKAAPAKAATASPSAEQISPDQSVAEDQKVINIPGLFQLRPIKGLSVNTLQEWRGVVRSIDEDSFTAELVDAHSAAREQEFADIPLSEVDPSDRHRLSEGAMFHLLIGFTKRPGGNHGRETLIYFRRHTPSRTSSGAELADLLDELDE